MVIMVPNAVALLVAGVLVAVARRLRHPSRPR
jgi:hypothetical protein